MTAAPGGTGTARPATAVVGFAAVDITPPAGLAMAGFAARTEPATGAHDPLTVQAVWVEPPAGTPGTATLLVVADLVALDPDTVATWTAAIRSALAPQDVHVAIGVTHTHGGPAVSDRSLGGRVDLAYLDHVGSAVVTAGRDARAEAGPATVAVGRSELHTVAHNRRGEDVIDPAVLTIAFRSAATDELVGVVFSHACHPVTLGPDNLAFTADWPGLARTRLAAEHGAPAVFVQGCAGELNTGHTAADSIDGRLDARRTFAEAQRLADAVAQAATVALRAARTTDGGPIGAVTARVELPFVDDVAPPLVVEIARLDWAGATLITLPGEPFVGLALDARADAGDPMLLVAGYTGGVPGYLPYPPDRYAAGGYEIEHAHRFYDRSAAFAPTAGSAVRAAARRLLGPEERIT